MNKKQTRFPHHINHHRTYTSRKNRKRALGVRSVPESAKDISVNTAAADDNIFRALASLLMMQQGKR